MPKLTETIFGNFLFKEKVLFEFLYVLSCTGDRHQGRSHMLLYSLMTCTERRMLIFHVTRTNKTCHESFKNLLFVCNMVSSLFYDTSLDTTVFISPFAGIHFNLGRLIFSLPKLREEGNVLDMRVTGRPASIIH